MAKISQEEKDRFPQFQYARVADDGKGTEDEYVEIYDEPEGMDDGDIVGVYRLVGVKRLSKKYQVRLS